MPTKQDLPEALAPLSRRNAIELSETRFHADVDRLIEAIEKPRAVASGEQTVVRRSEASTASSPAPERKAGYGKVLIAAGVVLALGGLIWFVTAQRRPGPASDPAEAAVAAVTPAPVYSPAPDPETTSSPLPRDAQSSNSISHLLTSGESPNPNDDDWIQETRKRAENGSAEAQFEMGTFYELGFTSVPEDRQKAMEWYRKAADQGHVLAKEGLEDLSKDVAALSPAEALKRDTRRTSRQQRSSSAVLNAMDAKVKDAIKKIKE